ncbi:SGNH/GDSL hydrolase family protein [Seonamhaeicola sp. MEBiC1930]|uniref:SGNH/GDSL hydrolase family protein n=1 Tax=Seonamhaeicola sp. MEBiC01930 TaxID=2976768 RepID=UPI00324D8C77
MSFYKKLIIFTVALALNAVVGYSQTILYQKPEWGAYTIEEEGFLLAHIFNWPEDGKLVIDRNIKPREAMLLSEPNKKIKIKLIDNKLTILLPEKVPNAQVSVVQIKLVPNEDWANLKRYNKANKELKISVKKKKTVVFMGNSITQNWIRDHGVFFKENPSFINRGISGQTTPQMLVRFRPDVIDLNPDIVIIHAGTNDIAGNTGPITIDRIAGNIFSMAELAKENGIQVILASVLPATSYSWSPSIEPADKIIELNKLIKDYAEENKIVYLDYYSPMVNDIGGLKKELGRDTVHPNVNGYLVMEPLVKQAIGKY